MALDKMDDNLDEAFDESSPWLLGLLLDSYQGHTNSIKPIKSYKGKFRPKKIFIGGCSKWEQN
ncbi:MAG: hypothetical protein R2825_21195 [Saprospiraceae bacterium]